MSRDNNKIVFAKNPKEKAEALPTGSWKILIVDDEEEVHSVTKLALRHFLFENKILQFFHAYSEHEANQLVLQNPDIAVILLDVVMETDNAGLQVAQHIRETLQNHLVQIILRTGQPGIAPEKDIIVNYSINDYKSKTELTAQKLYTTMVASLRSYSALRTIDNTCSRLEHVIDAGNSLFLIRSLEDFVPNVLTQLLSILQKEHDTSRCQAFFAATNEEGDFFILAGTGSYIPYTNRRAEDVLPQHVYGELLKVSVQNKSLYYDDHCVLLFGNKHHRINIAYLEGFTSLKKVDKKLLEVFCTNTAIAIDNIVLKQEIEDTQKEVVYRMGAIGETRSKETSNHVKRVAEYSKLLALKYGLTLEEAELLKQASPMHDIGKVGIPDSILNKPGKHTPEEWEIMKTHAQLGYEMLGDSSRSLLKAASIVALEHHEKWDGNGYPRALSGENIHVYGRITALADVFDALGSDRCYKKAWPLEDILDLIKRERGKHFDPNLVDLLLNNLPEFLAIRDSLRDNASA